MISFLPGSAEADPIGREGEAEAMPGPVAARGRALQEPTRSRGAGGEEPGGPHGWAARVGNAHEEGAEVRGNGTRSPPQEERAAPTGRAASPAPGPPPSEPAGSSAQRRGAGLLTAGQRSPCPGSPGAYLRSRGLCLLSSAGSLSLCQLKRSSSRAVPVTHPNVG